MRQNLFDAAFLFCAFAAGAFVLALASASLVWTAYWAREFWRESRQLWREARGQ